MIEAPTPADIPAAVLPRGQALRRGLRANPLLLVGALTVLFIVVVATAAPLLAPFPGEAMRLHQESQADRRVAVNLLDLGQLLANVPMKLLNLLLVLLRGDRSRVVELRQRWWQLFAWSVAGEAPAPPRPFDLQAHDTSLLRKTEVG